MFRRVEIHHRRSTDWIVCVTWYVVYPINVTPAIISLATYYRMNGCRLYV
jgi:hypothetical protein